MSLKVKRPCDEVITTNAKTLIFDIEGTTTSISFVKDTLFPYVRSNLETYIAKQWNTDEFKADLTLLKEQAVKDAADEVKGYVPIPTEGSDAAVQEAIVANILWQMDTDRKTKALKQLQGHIMREGYERGELKGHLYADVAPALQAWTESGCKLYIYSSGSVEAQKLLFGYSEQGDLLKLFHGHFDTEMGPKGDVASYTNILKHLECVPSDVVFFTDVPTEAKAAEGAGMTAVLVVREGNAPLSEEDRVFYQVIDSFNAFESLSSLKRRKVSADAEISTGEACVDIEMTDVSEAPIPVAPKVLDVTEAVEDEVKPSLPAESLDEAISVTEIEQSQTSCVENSNSDAMETTNTETPTASDKTESRTPSQTSDKTESVAEKEECHASEVKESKIDTMETTNNDDKTATAMEAEPAGTAQVSVSDMKESAPAETNDDTKTTTAIVVVPCVAEEKVSEPVKTLEASVEKTVSEEKVIEEPKIVMPIEPDVANPVVVKALEEVITVLGKEDPEEALLPEIVTNAADEVDEQDLKSVESQSKPEETGDAQSEVIETEVSEKVKIDETDEKSDDMKANEVKEEKGAVTEVKAVKDEKEIISEKEIVSEVKDIVMEKIEVATEVEEVVKEDKLIATEVKEIMEEKTVPEASDEKIEESVAKPTEAAEDPRKIETGESMTVVSEIEQNGVSGSADEKIADVTDQKGEVLEKIDAMGAKVEGKNISEEANDMDTVESKDLEEGEAEKIEGEKDSGKMDITDTATEGKASEGMDIMDTKVPKEEGEVTKNGVVEMGQGDAGTLVEVSKNVENGKDTIQADEIKVKKMLVDDTSDNTENAVPVAMET